ncbi:MAG: alpha/beta hydrolase [bacterium]
MYKYLFILTLILSSACKHQVPRVDDPCKIQVSVLQTGKTEIEYYFGGRGDTTLLFLHGWCLNKDYWNSQLMHYCANYRVIAPDLPGFGESINLARKDWSIATYGEDISGFIRRLRLKNVILIGHAMSGDIALQVAVNEPKNVIGLIGVESFKNVGLTNNPEENRHLQSLMQLLKDDFRNIAPAYAAGNLFSSSTPDNFKERVKSDFVTANPEVALLAFKSVNDFGNEKIKLLQELPYKLYLINNEITPTFTQSLTKLCPYSFELYTTGQTGHFPMCEDELLFNQVLDKVLLKIRE